MNVFGVAAGAIAMMKCAGCGQIMTQGMRDVSPTWEGRPIHQACLDNDLQHHDSTGERGGAFALVSALPPKEKKPDQRWEVWPVASLVRWTDEAAAERAAVRKRGDGQCAVVIPWGEDLWVPSFDKKHCSIASPEVLSIPRIVEALNSPAAQPQPSCPYGNMPREEKTDGR